MRAASDNPRILLATTNAHKIEEIVEMLDRERLKVQVLSLLDFPQLVMPEETGSTFEENALLKARFAAEETGLISLADDSGLEVEALNGAPGVHSKRFAGDNADDARRYGKLLDMMKDIPDQERQARFRCCIVIFVPPGDSTVVEGVCRGSIARAPRGENGFGYDPVFVPEGYSSTMAELTMEEKNRISHRARALEAALPEIRRLLKHSLPAG